MLTRASAPVSVPEWCGRLMGGGGPSQCRTPTYAPAGGTKRQPPSVTAMRFKAIERGGDIHCVVTCALPFAYDVLRKTTPLHDEYLRKLEAGLRCGISIRPMSAWGQTEKSLQRDGTAGLPSTADIF